MNPITRIVIVFFLWLGLSIVIAFSFIPDVSELPYEFIVGTVIIAPLIVGVSFSIDVLVFSRKWRINNKRKVIITYALIVGYLILNFNWTIAVLENMLDISYWQSNLPD